MQARGNYHNNYTNAERIKIQGNRTGTGRPQGIFSIRMETLSMLLHTYKRKVARGLRAKGSTADHLHGVPTTARSRPCLNSHGGKMCWIHRIRQHSVPDCDLGAQQHVILMSSSSPRLA